MAAPMPEAAPVTIVTLFFRENIVEDPSELGLEFISSA
jgi:hypothetical protein